MKNFFFFLITISLFSSVALAGERDTSRYEEKTEITVKGIVTPKIVQYNTHSPIEGETLLLTDFIKTVPHRWMRTTPIIDNTNLTVSNISSPFSGTPSALLDQNNSTLFAFEPQENGNYSVTISFAEPTVVRSVDINLGSGIIPPKKVSVSAVFADGKNGKLISRGDFSPVLELPNLGNPISLSFIFETPHVLQIADISFTGEQKELQTNSILFFAEEGKTYTLYSKPHFGYATYTPDPQPLVNDEKTPIFSLPPAQKNPAFHNDFDGDGILDEKDLCPKDADSNNTDIDTNGRGDVCEDPDIDGIFSIKDNCPFVYNPGQEDKDQDKKGNACDTEENRWTENNPFLFWSIMGGIVVLLGGIMWNTIRKKS